MNIWLFWEILSEGARRKLRKYQLEHYGYDVDQPEPQFKAKVNREVHYPTLEECERNMRQRPHHLKRVV